jgi:hypothetical protein
MSPAYWFNRAYGRIRSNTIEGVQMSAWRFGGRYRLRYPTGGYRQRHHRLGWLYCG